MADEYVRMKKSTLTAIGDAIRSKEGSTELIPPLEMPARIEAICGGVNFDTFIEVEENIVTNGAEVRNFFGDKLQSLNFLAILIGESDGTNNQCIAMLGGSEDGHEGAFIRIRDGVWQVKSNTASYDAAIVPGTKYGVIIPK